MGGTIENCFFCTQPKEKLILEDNVFFSIYDAAPVSPGHAIVVPKFHIVSFFDMLPDMASDMHAFILKVKEKVDAKYKPHGYNIGINDGRAAGRSIDHLHVHLIPRYNGDVPNPRGGVRNLKGVYIPPKEPPKGYGFG